LMATLEATKTPSLSPTLKGDTTCKTFSQQLGGASRPARRP
jgi:hypothetical protein